MRISCGFDDLVEDANDDSSEVDGRCGDGRVKAVPLVNVAVPLVNDLTMVDGDMASCAISSCLDLANTADCPHLRRMLPDNAAPRSSPLSAAEG
mmetsp:Transcript_28745/g.66935  ORF Transcript_28745/g.66935 Transcript_28745/m.66935 type:complete len:94 (-) Transcript_28745:310-591(-)